MRAKLTVLVVLVLLAVLLTPSTAAAQNVTVGVEPGPFVVYLPPPVPPPLFLNGGPRYFPPPIVRPYFIGSPGYVTYYPTPIVYPYAGPRVWVFTIRVPREEEPQQEQPRYPRVRESEPERAGPKVIWVGEKK